MIIYLIIYLLYLLFKFYYTFITKFITKKKKLFLFLLSFSFLLTPDSSLLLPCSSAVQPNFGQSRRRAAHLAWSHPRQRLSDPRNPQKRRDSPCAPRLFCSVRRRRAKPAPPSAPPQLGVSSLAWKPTDLLVKEEIYLAKPFHTEVFFVRHRGATAKPPNACAASFELTLS